MLTSRTKQLKLSQIQVNRIKTTTKHIKILASRTKQLKSKSNASKQKQINYKIVKNTTNKNKITKKQVYYKQTDLNQLQNYKNHCCQEQNY